MKDRRKTLEDDTLLGVLQTEPFRVVLVLAFERFDLNVVLERFLEIRQVLDVQLDVWFRTERVSSSQSGMVQSREDETRGSHRKSLRFWPTRNRCRYT